jgi:hypothetical protein
LWDVGLNSKWTSAEPSAREVIEGNKYYTFRGREIGTATSYVYGKYHSSGATSEGDAGLISITGSAWDNFLKPMVAFYEHTDEYSILGTHYDPESRSEGFVLCASGAPILPVGKENKLYNPGLKEYPVATVRCGTTGERSSPGYSDEKGLIEATPKDLIEIKLCNKKITTGMGSGASGSPIFKGHLAYGIYSGSTKNGCIAYFEGANNAEYALKVHILTAPMTFSGLT